MCNLFILLLALIALGVVFYTANKARANTLPDPNFGETAPERPEFNSNRPLCPGCDTPLLKAELSAGRCYCCGIELSSETLAKINKYYHEKS